jgi:DNA-binding LacI/PurR family transcriptional regulator
MPPHNGRSLGRAAIGIAEAIRKDIREGRCPPGKFIPSVRELATAHSVDRETVRRALKGLEAEGLIASEPRQGYRVLPRANDPNRGCPLACVIQATEGSQRRAGFGGSSSMLLNALREASEHKGWPLLSVASGGKTVSEVLEQVRSSRAFGLALDIDDPKLITALKDTGLPAVLVNSWIEEAGLDSVMQDGQAAGLLAARYLVAQGCKRIAWVGHDQMSSHVMDRLSGAVAGLDRAGLDLPLKLRFKVPNREHDSSVRRLLTVTPRPDGVIVLWRGPALALARVAKEMGIKLGRDLHLVGWCPEELHEESWVREFPPGGAPPAVTWSVRTMAQVALARVAERRENPTMPPVRVKVPVKLSLEP